MPAGASQRTEVQVEQVEFRGPRGKALEWKIVTVTSSEHRDPGVRPDMSLQQAPGRLPRRRPPPRTLAIRTERVAGDVRRRRWPGPRHRNRGDQPSDAHPAAPACES
jgi:hypothetical protein